MNTKHRDLQKMKAEMITQVRKFQQLKAELSSLRARRVELYCTQQQLNIVGVMFKHI